MSERERNERTLHAYFDGINGEDYEAVAALFAADGELLAPGAGVRRGAAEIEQYFAAALAPYREHLDDPTRFIYAGPTVTVEIHFSGSLASGDTLEFDAVDVFDLDGEGRIERLTSWYDSHAVRGALRRIRERQPK
jgi:ketosteroid isomerase-like protein